MVQFDGAACLGSDLWFPTTKDEIDRTDDDYEFATTRAEIAAASEICEECPAVVECYEFAQETEQYDGVWGGHHLGREAHGMSLIRRSAKKRAATVLRRAARAAAG